MTLTLKGHSKNGKQAYYSGAAQVVRFVRNVFPDGIAPQTIEFSEGVLAEPKVKVEKVKMTAEERKAANALKPKPTLAEKIERRRLALARDEAKLAASNQPSM